MIKTFLVLVQNEKCGDINGRLMGSSVQSGFIKRHSAISRNSKNLGELWPDFSLALRRIASKFSFLYKIGSFIERRGFFNLDKKLPEIFFIT